MIKIEERIPQKIPGLTSLFISFVYNKDTINNILEIIKEQTGDMPILILDDVLSELDLSRRTKLLKFCALTQTFISSTDKPERIPNSNIIKIDNARKI